GILLAIVAIPILVTVALDKGGEIRLFAALVYAITMVLEYTMSTLYHAIAAEKAKRIFKILDHSCIYLFIAGSYTPFCLVSLADSGGVWLCAFVWTVALIGVACEAFWVFRPRWISAALYLLLGWSVIWFIPALLEALPATGLWLLVGGGLCYSVGCIFYVLKKIPYMHSIFHLWVLAGSICQFIAIAFYVL
ncbi:MAG: hemolysin III family protein, partial [Raoultibacter sp.]